MYRARNPRASPLWQCAKRHAGELREAGRVRRSVETKAIERFIECGDPHHGFARIYCDACGHDVLATDGAFHPDGMFVPLPPVPEALLAEGFRRAVLGFLVKARAITEELRSRLLGWRHFGGFSVHNQVRVGAEDPGGRQKLAGYMLRAPMSLEKMTYDAKTGTVIYRSKMHAGLKRNLQVMPGAQWLELLLRHVPDRYEHLVRYVGWYSNRSRGERAKARKDQDVPSARASARRTRERIRLARQGRLGAAHPQGLRSRSP